MGENIPYQTQKEIIHDIGRSEPD